MIKIAICENDILDAQRISTILGAHKASSEFETVYFQSGSEIEADMNCHQYDLYIFDVELEDKETGLHYAQLVKDKYPAAVILFVSGHERYARFGYLSGAIRFVYKPQLLKELPEAIDFALVMIRKSHKTLSLTFNGNTTKIKLSSILYIEKIDRKIHIHITGNETVMSTMSLHAFLENVDPAQFVYICKGILVNLQHVKAILDGKIYIDELSLPLYASRRYVSSFRTAFTKFIPR